MNGGFVYDWLMRDFDKSARRVTGAVLISIGTASSSQRERETEIGGDGSQ